MGASRGLTGPRRLTAPFKLRIRRPAPSRQLCHLLQQLRSLDAPAVCPEVDEGRVPAQLRSLPGMQPQLDAKPEGEGMAETVAAQVNRHAEALELAGEELSGRSSRKDVRR